MSYPTWSDLSSPSIVPPLGARQAPDIGPAALMVSTDPDLKYIRSNIGKLSSKPFFTGHLLTPENANDGLTIVGPYIGAPYAVMLLESLIAKGAKNIIVLGWCGAITKALVPGDLLVVENAIVDEGTSRHYCTLQGTPPRVAPDPDLTRRLETHLNDAGENPHCGTIWTTDAIYRETPEKVAWYKEKGALAVEMECSALFAVAAFRNVRIAALLVVSDSLAKENGDWDPGFRKKEFKRMRKSACKAAVAMTGTLKNGF